MVKTCVNCNTNFIVPPSVAARAKCCSRDCRTAFQYKEAAAQVRKMSKGERMWFAGLFDGEGSIVQTQRKRTPDGSFRIQVVNTVVPLLERIQEYTGAGRINALPRKTENPRHSDAWVWSAGTGAGLEILRQVRPWLIVKAERADAVLEGRTFERQGRWDHLYS